MSASRKVRPVAALDAERRDRGYWVTLPGVGYHHMSTTVTDDEFAEHFAPAELPGEPMSKSRKVRSIESLTLYDTGDAVSVYLCGEAIGSITRPRAFSHFMPAHLYDDLLAAAREMADSPEFDWERRRGLLREAVRAHDALTAETETS